MSTFSAMDVGRTGVGFASYWLDQLAHNMANANTVTSPDEEPFRARLVLARPLPQRDYDGGVYVSEIREAGGDPALVHEPQHPLADEDGNVAAPVVDLSAQMTDLIIAQRTYQANLRSIETAKEAYQSALRLGGR